MNRRDFLSPFTHIRACLDKVSALSERQEAARAEERNDLFLRAMAQGIDPATLDPEQLPELLGQTTGGDKPQGQQ